MITTTVTIINQLGLHARASAKFVSAASRFQSQLEIIKGTKTVNGKRIMGVMMLGAHQGTELILQMDGPDEEAMNSALVTLIADRFHESE